MPEVDNLDANLNGYFQLSFIMARIGNIDANSREYFKLSRSGKGR